MRLFCQIELLVNLLPGICRNILGWETLLPTTGQYYPNTGADHISQSGVCHAVPRGPGGTTRLRRLSPAGTRIRKKKKKTTSCDVDFERQFCRCQCIQMYVSGDHRTDAGPAACLTQIPAGSPPFSPADRLHQLHRQYLVFRSLPRIFTLK